MPTVSIRIAGCAFPVRPMPVAPFLYEWNIAAFFVVQLPHVIPRNSVEKCRRRAFFFVEFPGVSNQRQKRLLHDIRCGFRAFGHVNGKPVQTTLMTAVKFQKCVLIPCGEAPHKFDIPWFGQI
jgi:hypothetical protein